MTSPDWDGTGAKKLMWCPAKVWHRQGEQKESVPVEAQKLPSKRDAAEETKNPDQARPENSFYLCGSQ